MAGKIHDPFMRHTVLMKGWKHAWNALFGGIKVEVAVDGSQGAQRAVMTLNPHALAADSVRMAEERMRSRMVHVAGDLTPEQIRGYRLMDNRSNEETSWDSAVLSMELGELKGLGFDMAMTGFSIGELNSLVPTAAGLTEDDAVPAPLDTPGYGFGRLLAARAQSPGAMWRLDLCRRRSAAFTSLCRSAPCTDLQVLLDDRPQALSSDPYCKRYVPVGFVLVALLSIATPAVAFRPLPLSARDQKALHDNFSGPSLLPHQDWSTLVFGIDVLYLSRYPDPGEQAVLTEIQNLRHSGQNLRGIAATLNHRALRTRRGSTWRLEHVARILKHDTPALNGEFDLTSGSGGTCMEITLPVAENRER